MMAANEQSDTRTPLIVAQNLTKSYGNTPVLHDFSLDVMQGEVVVLIGPSGSGKTTFIRTLNGLETVDTGRIVVNGTVLADNAVAGNKPHKPHHRTLQHVRRDVGMVFQQFNLFPHMSALENVMEAPVRVRKTPREVAKKRALELLDRMGLADRADHRPHELSGGQQQRVAISRALAMDPSAILFDEVTSALDPELVGEVLRAMRELAADGMTMIVVTHEMQFARQVADRVVMMAGGRLVEEGTPQQIFSSPKDPRTANFVRSIVSPDPVEGLERAQGS
ncbi:amino acid ABC transporter ATP-binding protein [Actinacidiphila soli]|uniref:amino acid ABC transporter ATP-binding protein n=1 Tax=Actinacidiphila soli TaxID=2487275 RepID=UPI002B001AF7|nr:amino acid ABC transporter ATP-binding protein [Actinacidiphila soli]